MTNEHPYRTAAAIPEPILPEFSGAQTRCIKCTKQGPTHNVFQATGCIRRKCMDCQYVWHELAADGTGSPP